MRVEETEDVAMDELGYEYDTVRKLGNANDTTILRYIFLNMQ